MAEAFVGAAYVPASSPASVGGNGYPAPGVATNPPNAPSGRAMRARHNRGSNVRLPYARIVPLQSREEPRTGPNGPRLRTEPGFQREAHPRTVMVNGVPALEYDGLKEGELAWILGRRFNKLIPDDGLQGALAGGADPLDELSLSQRYGHQAYAGQGIGVDRMQRLASTAWMESMMLSKATSKIHLHALRVDADYALAMDAGLKANEALLAGALALYAPDLLYTMTQITRNTARNGAALVASAGLARNYGLSVLETGPFLRGVQVDSSAFDLAEAAPFFPSHIEGRNSCDAAAFSTLMLEVRRRNLMDWTPDGIVVSKLESPAQDSHTSIAMDARSAQTFNVAVQGPAITTSWTSDVQDTRLLCQPMDKVFVCLVADLAWTTDAAMDASLAALLTARDALTMRARFLHEAIFNDNIAAIPAAQTAFDTAVADALQAADDMVAAVPPADTPYEQQVAAVEAAEAALQAGLDNPLTTDAQKATLRSNLATAKRALDELLSMNEDYASVKARLEAAAPAGSPPSEEDIVKEMERVANANIDAVRLKQERIRQCARGHIVARATLTKFRLMRSTSSHMVNYSNLKALDSNSRCGLRLGKLAPGGGSGAGEYIIGAWCIGTVADSAASRSNNGAPFKITPTNMTINLNVNVEWWSGDQLYKQFMDTSGLVLMRGKQPPLVPGTGAPKRLLSADVDVPVDLDAEANAAAAAQANADADQAQADAALLQQQADNQYLDAAGNPLVELLPDGTPRRDNAGNPIPLEPYPELLSAPGVSRVSGGRVAGSRSRR